MTHDIGRADEADLDERDEGEDFDPEEYDTMMELERLESVEEEMRELGVTSLDDVRRRIADLHRELDED
ncbi:MAG: hypothetical protein ACXWQR_01100 [Ktedonobacterales bacterium]